MVPYASEANKILVLCKDDDNIIAAIIDSENEDITQKYQENHAKTSMYEVTFNNIEIEESNIIKNKNFWDVWQDISYISQIVPQIEVTFDIDANGIVNVSAKDRATDKEQSITISGESNLSDADIETMVKDAESHAEEDRQRREAAEVRNNADALVYQIEKMLVDQAEQVTDADKMELESALSNLKEALADENDDSETIRKATDNLTEVSQSFSQKLYETAAQQAADGDPNSEDNVDDVVDAEIIDEDQ